ncbi:unnamed protein product (mitochondrion) [Plasmodiophora brassicae]|uniref:Uncharacterized protein n=1 Tax=Plasmodiophora brassicae TaxID=37360 RepID=A0A3P3XZS0_PLABS|nr:unnamed protein product [Plasmodiophora brassicae]
MDVVVDSDNDERPCACRAAANGDDGGFWCNQMKLCILLYVLSNSLCIVTVKFINYRYEFVLPMMWAMLSETTWIASIPLFFLFNRTRPRRISFIPPLRILSVCALIGTGYSISKTIISYSENVLPGSVYAILSSLDILFNGVFSRIVFGKRLSNTNTIAVLLVIAGVLPNALTSVVIADKHRDATDKAIDVTGLALAVAIPVAILGIAEQAFSTVASSYILKRRIREQTNVSPSSDPSVMISVASLSDVDCTDNVVFIIQYSSWVSLIAFLGMCIPLYFSGEAHLWWPTLRSAFDGSGTVKHAGYDAVLGLSVAAAITIATRMYMRLAKYYICSLRTAFTFAAVKPLPRILQILVLCLAMGEVITIAKVIGMTVPWNTGSRKFTVPMP